jgi:hypothetical protein
LASVWLRILVRDLARSPRQIAARLALVGLAAAALAAFAFVLPAYRGSFTAAIEHARFDVDLAACDCTNGDIAKIRSLVGVRRVAPVLGIGGMSLASRGREAGAWAWAIDNPADADLLPVGPDYLVDGAYDLGTTGAPKVVVDLELARQLNVGVGDLLTARFPTRSLELQVSGVTGPAARFRGPTLVLLRGVVTPLIPADSPLRAAPFTEVFIQGTVSTAAIASLFPAGTTAVYSKQDQIAAQQAQIELSQPVIEVISVLAAVGLLTVLGFMGWQAIDRRRELLSLLPHLGTGWSTGLTAILVLEGMPTASAAGAGSVIGLTIIVNGYFAGIGAFVAFWSTVAAAGAVALTALLLQAAIYALSAGRLARR